MTQREIVEKFIYRKSAASGRLVSTGTQLISNGVLIAFWRNGCIVMLGQAGLPVRQAGVRRNADGSFTSLSPFITRHCNFLLHRLRSCTQEWQMLTPFANPVPEEVVFARVNETTAGACCTPIVCDWR
ncbi:MAG TPA: hypothetical protein VNQ79_12010 [Blastocatellia bacterium]|nr:hypothetical protein [Blastocatellia bacterium]